MKTTIKRFLVVVIIIISGIVYFDINYHIVGPGEKLYCYLIPFLTPGDSSADTLPIGKFIGNKQDIEKVKEANLNYQTAWILFIENNNPDILLPFIENLPESNTVDPDELSEFEKSKLLQLHLWDGRSKINFFATFKEGAILRKKEEKSIAILSALLKKYPKLFKNVANKVKALKQSEIENTNLVNSFTDYNEKLIAENLLFIRKLTGITVQSETDLKNLESSKNALEKIVGKGDFNLIKQKIEKDINKSIIGIKTEGNKAILVYGIPDGLYTQVRKFVRAGNTYKLYTIVNVKHTKSIDLALSNYWKKQLEKTNAH